MIDASYPKVEKRFCLELKFEARANSIELNSNLTLAFESEDERDKWRVEVRV
jgi:hypothetical protein